MAQPQLQESAGSGRPFRPPDATLESQDAPVHFAERSGIYIIDLQKTLRQIEAAQELLRGVILKGENVLFVCTKKQLKNILQAEAQRCGAFYVTERWLGGTLTNFQTIKKQIKRFEGAGAGHRRRRVRELHQEGAAAVRPRARQARQVPVGHQEHEPAGGGAVRGGIRRRSASRSPRRTSWVFRWSRSWITNADPE